MSSSCPPISVDWQTLAAPPPLSARIALEEALALAARAWSSRLAAHLAAAVVPAEAGAPAPRTLLEPPYGFMLDRCGDAIDINDGIDATAADAAAAAALFSPSLFELRSGGGSDPPRCFNCGAETHALSQCPVVRTLL
jgi:hypothetical protein